MRGLNVLIACRRILAQEREIRSLSEVAKDIIENIIMPKIAEEKAVVSDVNQSKYKELLKIENDFNDALSGRDNALKRLGEIAYRAIYNRLDILGISGTMIDDVAHDIVTEFYIPFMSQERNLQTMFKKFNVYDGLTGFFNLWTKLISSRTHWIIRDFIRQRPDILRKQEDIENPLTQERYNVVNILPDKRLRPDEAVVLEDLYLRLGDYVRGKLRGDDVALAVFDKWIEVVNKKGIDNVVLSRDVYDALKKELGVGSSYLARKYKEIQKIILDFFENELKISVSPALKKKLHISNIVDAYRRFIVQWILGK